VAKGDGTSRQLGKFTRLLVEGLRTGAGIADRDEITVADLFEHARRGLVAEDPRMRPQHWRERGEAPLVIARNPQARPRLPAELLAALDDKDPVRRRGAVDWLDELIKRGDPRFRAAALVELRRRVADEWDRRVHDRMRLAIQGLAEPPEQPQEHAGRLPDEPGDSRSDSGLERPEDFPQRLAAGGHTVPPPGRGSALSRLAVASAVVGLLAAAVAWVFGAIIPPEPAVPPSVPEQAAVTVSPAPASASHEPGDVFRDCPECPELVVVPAGSFTMGSPKDEKGRDTDEGPQRRVTIARPFAVGRFEVTFAEWDACVAGGGCGYRPSDQDWGRGRRPVIRVSWDDAQSYVIWLKQRTGQTYRLLSEAEWEYAARAGTTTPFWTGVTISTEQANYDGSFVYGSGKVGEYRQKTVEVGSLPANSWGLHEVHGNAYEWVEDCFKETYKEAPSDGSARNSADCPRRVLRSGSWDLGPSSLRAAARDLLIQDARGNSSVGFRVARMLTP
jgi:formylglycine-generating enzyme required for sulfatase activity